MLYFLNLFQLAILSEPLFLHEFGHEKTPLNGWTFSHGDHVMHQNGRFKHVGHPRESTVTTNGE